MAEPPRQVDALRAATPVRVGPVTVLAIERVVMHAERGGQTIRVCAALGAHALVVRDAGGVRVVGIDGAAPPLGHLRERIPGIDCLLDLA